MVSTLTRRNAQWLAPSATSEEALLYPSSQSTNELQNASHIAQSKFASSAQHSSFCTQYC
eukprot:6728501-Lingulodinium_polyedra.AAC.1